MAEASSAGICPANGKLRGRIKVATDTSKKELAELALADENVQRYIVGKDVRKTIVVPGRLVNVVV